MFDLDYDLTKYRSVMVFYWEMFGDSPWKFLALAH